MAHYRVAFQTDFLIVWLDQNDCQDESGSSLLMSMASLLFLEKKVAATIILSLCLCDFALVWIPLIPVCHAVVKVFHN